MISSVWNCCITQSSTLTIKKIMKKILYTLLLGFLLCSKTLQAQNTDSLIVGQWVVDYNQTITLMPDHLHAQYDSLAADMVAEIRAGLEGQQFIFYADNSFEAINTNGDSFPGQWSLNLQSDNLTLIYQQGTRLEKHIELLTDEQMVLKVAPDDSEALFHFIHLDLQSR